MNYDTKQLLQMSHVELDEIFRKSPPGEMPDGRMKGTFIVAPGTWVTAGTAELIWLVVWRGKVFYGNEVKNQISPFSFESVPARVYKAPSRFDGNECIVLDYSETSVIARWVRDEIREVAQGLYLGKVWLAGVRMPDFILEREA